MPTASPMIATVQSTAAIQRKRVAFAFASGVGTHPAGGSVFVLLAAGRSTSAFLLSLSATVLPFSFRCPPYRLKATPSIVDRVSYSGR